MKRLSKKIFAVLLLLILLLMPVERMAACPAGNSDCQSPTPCSIFSRTLSDLVSCCQTSTTEGESLSSTVYRLLQSIYHEQNVTPQKQQWLTTAEPNNIEQVAPDEKEKQSENTVSHTYQATGELTKTTESEYAAEVVRLVNVERANAGLPALEADPLLTEAAALRTVEIIDLFSHTRPNGSSCFTVLDELQATYRLAGENIAIGQQTPQQVVSAWMDSPGHRDNILHPGYSRIGVACLENNNSYGGYAWAQLFAA